MNTKLFCVVPRGQKENQSRAVCFKLDKEQFGSFCVPMKSTIVESFYTFWAAARECWKLPNFLEFTPPRLGKNDDFSTVGGNDSRWLVHGALFGNTRQLLTFFSPREIYW